MFSSGPNYTKLKTHLRLAINRLKLLEKKKTELAQKARKEIADYIAAGKYERAKIRVEHIIREDYLVEAFECVEMYCDLLLARFGLIQQMKTLDEGLAEPISSLLWVSPRIQADIAEMKVITELLTAKYGRPYADACREDAVASISEKLKHKMSVQSPPKLLVEKYLIEIAKNYNIQYEPDPQVMQEEKQSQGLDALLFDLGNDDPKNNLGGGGNGGSSLPPQPAGFFGYPQPPLLPNYQPFNYPAPSDKPSGGAVGGFVAPPPLPSQGPSAGQEKPPQQGYGVPFSYNIPPGSENTSPDSPGGYGGGFGGNKPLNTNNIQPEDEVPPPSYSSSVFPPDLHDSNTQRGQQPKPAPRGKLDGPPNFPDLPELPSVPTDSFGSRPGPGAPGNESIDFDDLTRRFEELKRKK